MAVKEGENGRYRRENGKRWLASQDSNLGQRSQSPLCYRCTTRHPYTRIIAFRRGCGNACFAGNCKAMLLFGIIAGTGIV